MMIYLQMIDSPEDRSKFEQIYMEYRSMMFHIANRILTNEQDAEDAVHEAFLKIAENIAKIGEKINVRRFVRYGLGEGIEKRQDDFVAEVMASVGK